MMMVFCTRWRLRTSTIVACCFTLLTTVQFVVSKSFASECLTCVHNTLRPCDQLWQVSTRAFPCGDPRLHAESLTYQMSDEFGAWRRADLPSFLKTDDPSVTTVIWVH